MQFRHIFGHTLCIEAAGAAAVFVLVVLAIAVAIAGSRRRKRAGAESSPRSENNRLEVGFLAVLAVAVAALVTLSFTSNGDEPIGAATRPALTVRVTAFQWCWRFSYPGHPVTVTGPCAGRSEPVLVLPAHRLVKIEVTSADVIHSFWVPYLRFKLDAYPDHVSSFEVTLPRAGLWQGRCAQFCGLFHYQMDFGVRVVSPAAFGRWLAQHARTAGQAGVA